MNLDHCGGPECPRCGCRDTEVLQAPRPDAWFARAGRARCRHCGRSFIVTADADAAIPAGPEPEPSAPIESDDPPREDGVVRYVLVRCPECGSSDTAITRTSRPIRYHKCRACNHAFKSVEG